MTVPKRSVLFLGKADDPYVERALAFCQQSFDEVEAFLGRWGDTLPERVESWEGAYIFSYLSRWIIPVDVLNKATLAALNFHPAPPEHPGMGPINFALYAGDRSYGVTCHHMAPRVDAGALVAIRRFRIFEEDTVSTLLARSYDHLITLFYDIVTTIVEGKSLPTSDERWTRPPRRRKHLNALAQIDPAMTQDEVAKRIRATSFGPWRPRVTVHGFTFELKVEPESD